MFRIQPNPTFSAEVSIHTPDGVGKVTFVFKHKGKKALQAFLKSFTDAEAPEDINEAETLMGIVEGWDGVDTKFSAKALETLLDNYPSAGRAIIDAYVPALLEGQEKN